MKFFWFIFLFIVEITPILAKPAELIFWHSMSGQLGSEVKKLTDGFNESQTSFVVKPIYKGDYLESLTSFAAAFRAKQAPAMIQILEVGKATMLFPGGIIKPVSELMREQKLTLPYDSFFPVVQAYYTEKSKLLALPFNISLPVIFYNADVLSKLGYNADTFPNTWDELEILALKLKEQGFPCAFTSAYTGWVLMESYSAVHGMAMFDPANNTAIYNNKFMIHHLERLRRWQKRHYFEYGGRNDDSTTLFTSGRCPLFSQSSGAFKGLSSLVSFHVGVGALPLDKEVSDKRFNNVVGGAALWAVAGQSDNTYLGIAQFFAYLSQPNVQQMWHLNTGYMPLGISGVYHGIVSSLHPIVRLAQTELTEKKDGLMYIPTGIQNQIRLINDEALELIFAGIKTPFDAMNDAVRRANHAMLRFRKNNKGARNQE